MSTFQWYNYCFCCFIQQCSITSQTNNSLFFINDVVYNKSITNYLLNNSTYLSKVSFNGTEWVRSNGTLIIYVGLFNNFLLPHKPIIYYSPLILYYRINLSLIIRQTSQYIFARCLLIEFNDYFPMVPWLFMLDYSTMRYYLTNQ